MFQFLSIIFFFLDFFNFCWVFQTFPFLCVTLYNKTNLSRFISVCNFLISLCHERREYVEENNNKVTPKKF